MYSAHQRLVGEAHVHHAGRMPLGRRQVDQPSFGQQVDAVARRAGRTPRRSRASCAWRLAKARASAGMSISTSKWPVLATMAPSFITSKCSRRSTWMSPVAVTKMSPMRAASAIGHDPEAVHDRLERAQRIDLEHHHVGAVPLGPHGDAPPAPAVAGHDDHPAGDQHVGGADDAVQRRLPGAVPVVEEVLGERLVDGHDGVAQHAVRPPWSLQADHAGGGLLGAADDARPRRRPGRSAAGPPRRRRRPW